MNPLDMVDPEVSIEEYDDEVTITIHTDLGTADITVERWVFDAAMNVARDSVDEAAEWYQDLFDKVEAEVNGD